MNLLHRAIAAIWPPRHRFICKECGRIWDRWFDESPASPTWFPDKRSPAHSRIQKVQASDGAREMSVICGPVYYEGRRA